MSNTPDIDIRPDHWEIVRAILQEHVPQYEVWAFGSRAKWTAKEFSDLDLAIMTDEPLLKEVSAALADAFEESDLPYKVDVVDWAGASGSFQEAIQKGYISLTPKLAATSLKCHTIKISKLLQDNILYIGDGYRAKNSELSNIGIPFARAGNINMAFLFDSSDKIPFHALERVGNKRSQPGDVVFTSKGTVGRFAYVQNDTPDFVYSPQLCFWRVLDTQQINPRWLFYWMQGSEFYGQYKGAAGQTDMAEYVSLRDQRAMHITIPPLSEQHAIAHILGTLDDKIELNRRMNETLESMARAIFKDWFVDFGPVRAKAEGRQPDGVSSDIATLFPRQLNGEGIPLGWKIHQLSDILELAYGKALKASDRNEGKVAVYGSGGLTGCHDSALIYGPSIIVGRKGTVGSIFWEDEDSFPIDTTFHVKPKISIFFCYYLLCALNLHEMNTDAAVPGLNRNNVYRLKFVLPPEEIIKAFDAFTAPIKEKAYQIKRETLSLIQLRDTLLPKLVSGELRIKNAEKFVEEALDA